MPNKHTQTQILFTPGVGQVHGFAYTAKEHGFIVYLSDAGTYGCYSDNTGVRVVEFSYALGEGVTLTGKYKGGTNTGTGWRLEASTAGIDKDYLHNALYCPAPSWANKNPEYTSLSKFLGFYKSSNFYQI